MEQVPYSNLSKGTLLLASPDFDNGLYFRAVIIICEHNTNGSFGIILNKPLEVQLPEDILSLDKQSNPHIKIRAGGPVQPNQMMLLHSAETINDHALKLCDGVYLGGDLQFLQEAIANPSGPYVDLCFGYTGWPPGQLEREFLNGNWFLHPGSAKYVFETAPDKMWHTILRDMGGKYAMLSMIPDDLSLN